MDKYQIDQEFIDQLEKLEYSIAMEEDDEDDSDQVVKVLRQLHLESRVLHGRWGTPRRVK